MDNCLIGNFRLSEKFTKLHRHVILDFQVRAHTEVISAIIEQIAYIEKITPIEAYNEPELFKDVEVVMFNTPGGNELYKYKDFLIVGVKRNVKGLTITKLRNTK